MAGGAFIVCAIMTWLAWSALRGRVSRHTEAQARRYVIGGGVIFPTVVLATLLAHGLGRMPALLAPAPPDALRITVSGEQWWWRVRYHLPDGGEVELANEIRLPVNEPVLFDLESPDVIHAFWIPSLGGKIDMIPGRRTRLVLHPTRTGTFRGQCAEFCGDSHALMAFPVVVSDRPDFDAWLAAQARPAAPIAATVAPGNPAEKTPPARRCSRAGETHFCSTAAPPATACAARRRADASAPISPTSAPASRSARAPCPTTAPRSRAG